MLLKKQTVWLLTMLSLVVVLSVYYLTSPDQSSNPTATKEEEQSKQETAKSDATKETAETTDSDETSKVTISSEDDEFEALRMNIQDERAKMNEEYTTLLEDTDLSAEKRNEAIEAMDQLSDANITESILETAIMQLDYAAALVRIDGKKVNVTVKTEKTLEPVAAAEIMNIVETELDDAEDVAINFQPTATK